MPRSRTSNGLVFGSRCCYIMAALSGVYVPTMALAFVANGNLTAPIRDPYLAVMEVLILAIAVALVAIFAAVHAYAPRSAKTLSLAAFGLVVLSAGITVYVHAVLLTVGRQADSASLPGFDRLLAWKWPSFVYALDIASWDFFLGSALLLAAPVFAGPGLLRWVRWGLVLSGSLCLAGILGAVLGNMQVRNIGIVGYALVLPIALVAMGRVFARSYGTGNNHPGGAAARVPAAAHA